MAELVAASHVLGEMLPTEPLELGAGRSSGWVQPAQVVGGDSFDDYAADDSIKFLLADAVGHGLSATLMPLECRALWRALYRNRCLNETITALNLYLSADARGGERFVILCMGSFQPATGYVEYVCAGMAPCFLKQSEGVLVRTEADLPVGVMAEARYTERVLWLEPGDSLMFVTDGVAEWTNANREPFGEARIADFLARAPASVDLPRELLNRLQAFTRGYPQLDDAAVLALARS